MNDIIAFALRQRVLMFVLMAFAFVADGGFRKLNIEAYPDPVAPPIDIVAPGNVQWAEEIARHRAIPIEMRMAGNPNITAIGSISLFGLFSRRTVETGEAASPFELTE